MKDFINRLLPLGISLEETERDLYFCQKSNIALRFLDLDLDNVNNNPNIIQLNKTLKSKYQNILFFFKDEINAKPDLCISMILNKAHIKLQKPVYRASALEMREINTPSVHKPFFDKNHLSGYTQSSTGYGLFLNNQLLSCIIIRKAFTDGSYEIARFCTDYNVIIHGAFSRLIANWPSNKKLITYSDCRFSSGNVYSSNGFLPIPIEQRSSYWYTNGVEKHYRTSCQKNTLRKYGASLSKSEEQLAVEGYLGMKFYSKMTPMYRMYDLGHLKWGINLDAVEEDKREFMIYKYESLIDNKCYIGVTANEHRRKIQHKSEDPNLSGYSAMIQKYGEENISYVVLEKVIGLENVYEKEKQYIKKYRSLVDGFNKTAGGGGCQVGKSLDEDKVRAIRKDLKEGKETFKAIASRYGVVERTIRAVGSGKYWNHFEPEIIQKADAYSKGEDKYNAVVTEDIARQIKTMKMNGNKIADIARHFKLKSITVGAIVAERNWGHVKVEGFVPELDIKNKNVMTPELVREIRQLYSTGIKQVPLSKKYNVSRETIANIVFRRTWKDLTDED